MPSRPNSSNKQPVGTKLGTVMSPGLLLPCSPCSVRFPTIWKLETSMLRKQKSACRFGQRFEPTRELARPTPWLRSASPVGTKGIPRLSAPESRRAVTPLSDIAPCSTRWSGCTIRAPWLWPSSEANPNSFCRWTQCIGHAPVRQDIAAFAPSRIESAGFRVRSIQRLAIPKWRFQDVLHRVRRTAIRTSREPLNNHLI